MFEVFANFKAFKCQDYKMEHLVIKKSGEFPEVEFDHKKGNLKIPAPIPTLFVGSAGNSANQVNVVEPLLTAYMGNYFSSGYFTISDGDKVAQDPNGNGVIVGKRISAKNNNG